MFAEDKPVVSADKTSVVSADKTSVVSADKTSAVSADKTSVVSQDIPMGLRRRPQRGRVGNGIGMSWETTDVLSADTTDVLAADTTDVLAADTTDVLSADTTDVLSADTAGELSGPLGAQAWPVAVAGCIFTVLESERALRRSSAALPGDKLEVVPGTRPTP